MEIAIMILIFCIIDPILYILKVKKNSEFGTWKYRHIPFIYFFFNKKPSMKDKLEKTYREEKNQIELFTQIWISENVHDNYGVSKALDNEEYVEYVIWENKNYQELYNTYLPNRMVFTGFDGSDKLVVFHGGCLYCTSQELFGIKRCYGCQYFKAEWMLPDLSINVNKN
jgi:hypothetical protein